MQHQSSPKLHVSGLQAYYLTERGSLKAVDGINFEIQQGQSLGVVGESACGKSTLGAALMRSLQYPGKIVGGNVVLTGVQLTKLADSKFNNEIRWMD